MAAVYLGHMIQRKVALLDESPSLCPPHCDILQKGGSQTEARTRRLQRRKYPPKGRGINDTKLTRT